VVKVDLMALAEELDKMELLEVLVVELETEQTLPVVLDLVELQDHKAVVLVVLMLMLELVAVELLVKVEMLEAIVLVDMAV
tara:strand:+ start:194 stop:436 length:243 start_codon:yes stop_codon:yes gene_type:complete